MRYFLDPGGCCKVVCHHCAEASIDQQWGGWNEQDPSSLEAARTPECCDNCGGSMDEP